MEEYSFSENVGREFDFYGVDSNKFKLNDTVFEAIEDESDGYRSMLDAIVVAGDGSDIFFSSPIARVRVRVAGDGDNFEGFKLLDAEDDHEWLVIGTANTDDYYPSFTFQYNHKPDPNPIMETPIA